MATGTRMALGLATMWPLMYAALFVIVLQFVDEGLLLGEPSSLLRNVLAAVHLSTVVVALAVWAFYVRSLFTWPGMSPGRRAAWLAAFLFASLVAMPVYFWRVARKR
jgi:hypothetical protein